MPKLRKAVFPVNGQGIFKYTVKKRSAFVIYITPDKQKIKVDENDNGPTVEEDAEKPFATENYIALTAEENLVKFSLKLESTGEHSVLAQREKQKIGVEPGEFQTYWFSYDRDGMILKYGKGHTMEQTTLMHYDFLKDKTPAEQKIIRHRYQKFFNAEEKKYVVIDSKVGNDQLTGDGGIIKAQQMLRFSPYPLVCNFPYLIKDSSDVTLFDLDRDQFMFSSSLPKACLELYENIKGLTLEYPSNPIIKLTDAIRYSIETKGMTLYEKLREKVGNFKYLRVTLGPDQRTGPGIPYVLELWPKGQGSPIHNHGGACAIIKNLFGRISVKIFNKFTQPPEEGKMKPVLNFDLKENELTWIDPNWYQTHQLHNNTDDFCATIQCYRYDFNDTIQWPNFDYLSYVEGKEKYELEEFFPDSDFTFINLRSVVIDEYKKYLDGTSRTMDY